MAQRHPFKTLMGFLCHMTPEEGLWALISCKALPRQHIAWSWSIHELDETISTAPIAHQSLELTLSTRTAAEAGSCR